MGDRIIRDADLRLNEETGEVTVRRPGWRQDPTRRTVLTPAGEEEGGAGAAGPYTFPADKVLTVSGNGTHDVTGKSLVIVTGGIDHTFETDSTDPQEVLVVNTTGTNARVMPGQAQGPALKPYYSTVVIWIPSAAKWYGTDGEAQLD
jgi:hypothetical protein